MSYLRLGVSDQILPYTQREILEADKELNRFLIRTVQSALKGLGIGIFASLFFVRKPRIIVTAVGFGTGYTFFEEFGTSCKS